MIRFSRGVGVKGGRIRILFFPEGLIRIQSNTPLIRNSDVGEGAGGPLEDLLLFSEDYDDDFKLGIDEEFVDILR